MFLEQEKEPPRRAAQVITGRRHKDGMRIVRDGPVSRTVERDNGAGMVNKRLTGRRDRIGKLMVIRETGLTPSRTRFR